MWKLLVTFAGMSQRTLSAEEVIEGRKELAKLCGYKFHRNWFGSSPYLQNRFFKYYRPYSELNFESDRELLDYAIKRLAATKFTHDGFVITEKSPVEDLLKEPNTMKVFEVMSKLAKEYNGIK